MKYDILPFLRLTIHLYTSLTIQASAAIENVNPIYERSSNIIRNRVFDCHVYRDFRSAFFDCLERFRLPPIRCVVEDKYIPSITHVPV